MTGKAMAENRPFRPGYQNYEKGNVIVRGGKHVWEIWKRDYWMHFVVIVRVMLISTLLIYLFS
tara:strand:- start:10 stop:198 length:189 start_codon:yes stop_codon:yes gene_type:complete